MESLNFRAIEPLWSSIPTELLIAELSNRDDVKQRPECGSKELGAYNMSLHVFALFMVLVLSTGSCAIPVISRRSNTTGGSITKEILFYCQHFGTGVLMATAFVHLLPTAFMSLTNPCLPYVFSEGYQPLAGLIAMVSALVVVAIESYLHTRGAGHSHHLFEESDVQDEASQNLFNGHGGGAVHGSGYGLLTDDIELTENESSQSLIQEASLPRSASNMAFSGAPVGGSGGERPDDDPEGGRFQRVSLGSLPRGSNSRPFNSHSGQGPNADSPKSEEERKKLEQQCLLLEAGILFHSVFIGMSLSVAAGPSFIVFLVAIAFHQCFEGIALGTRIVAIQHSKSSWKPWLMVLAFGLTTPIGQAIGLMVREFYDPLSQTGLLMVGIMNAISSGLLLFAGLVQLLSEDFLSDQSYTTLHGKRRVRAFGSVVAGATLMALVGAFA